MKRITKYFPGRVALTYLLIASAWILVSDRILLALVSDKTLQNQLQTYKGWGFVLVTAILLYAVLQRESSQQLKYQNALEIQALLLENTRDAIITFTPDLNITFWNLGSEQLYGWKAEEIKGGSMRQLIFEGEGYYQLETAIETASRDGYALVELIQRHRNNTPIEVESSIVALRDANQNTSFAIISRDITERNRQIKDVQRLNRALLARSETSQILIRAENETDLLQDACETIAHSGSYPLVWIGEPVPGPEKKVRIITGAGTARAYLNDIRISWAENEYGQGPTGRAIRSGHTVIANQLAAREDYQPWKKQVSQFGLEASIALPVVIDQQVIAVLNVYASDPEAFDRAEVQLLEDLVHDLAFGIESLRTRHELARTLEALETGERRFRSLIENAPVGIAMSRQAKTVYANSAYLKMFGYADLAEIQALPLAGMLAPAAREEIIDRNRRRERGEATPQQYESTGMRKDGSFFPFHVSVGLIQMPEGPTTITFFEDLSERKETIDHLRRVSEELQKLVEASPVPIYIISPTGKVLSWNPAAEQTFGWKAAEVIGEPLPIIQAEKQAEFQSLLAKIRAGESFSNFPISRVRKNGQPIELSLNTAPLQDTRGNLTGILSITLDITENKRAENELRRQKEILQKIVDNVPAMIAYFDPGGGIEWINQAWTNTIGYSVEEIQQQHALERLYPDPAYRREVFDFISKAEGHWGDFQTHLPDGRVIDTMWANVRLSDGGNIGIGQDITERKRTERLVQEYASRLETLRQSGLDVAAQLDPDQIQETITQRAVALVSGNRGGLFLYDADLDQIVWTIGVGVEAPKIGITLERGEGLVGRVWSQRETIIVDNYQSWEDKSPKLIDYDWQSMIAAPIQWGDEFLGVVKVLADQPSVFTPQDANLLNLFAIQAAVALKNARQYRALQDQRQQLRELTVKLVEIEEVERKRLSALLHDRVGQTLAALSINLSMMQSMMQGMMQNMIPTKAQSDLHENFAESQRMLEEVGDQIRDVMAELRSPVLEDYGLAAGLSWYAEQFRLRTGLPIRIDSSGPELRLSPEVEVTLFRIAQEALTNIAKHARATQAIVNIQSDHDYVRMTIQDDGVGFQDGETGSNKLGHWGLVMMRERIEALGGKLELLSNPGEGTEIQIEIERKNGGDTRPARR